MTKKQKIFIIAAFVILITLIIICTGIYIRKNREIAKMFEQAETPEVKIERNITQPDISDILSESNQKPLSSEASKSSQTASGTQSTSTGSNLLRKTLKTAPPENSGYPIPKSHHFYEVRGSIDPNDKNKAELTINMNSSENYDLQLQELQKIIQPILGDQITQEILAIARTKTNKNVEFGKFFETDTKKVAIIANYNNPLVGFKSWMK